MDFSFLEHFISDTYLFKISDELGLQWNGLAISLSIICSFLLIKWLVSRQRFELSQKQVFDFIFLAVFGVLIGARVGYCLFIDRELFFQFNHELPYWGVLAINEGGFSSYGAILGGVLACGIYTYQTGISRLYLMDLCAVCAPLALLFSRTANIFTGELFGKVVDASFEVKMKVPQEILYWPFENIEKLKSLNELAGKAGIGADQWKLMTEQYSSSQEVQSSLHSALLQIVQYVSRQPSDYYSMLEPMLAPRFPISLLGAMSEGILLFFILLMAWYRPKRPGFISALFLILFSVVQILIDPLRQQSLLDAKTVFGISEHILLSMVCLALGITGLVIWNRSEILRAPGWGRGQNVKLHRR